MGTKIGIISDLHLNEHLAKNDTNIHNMLLFNQIEEILDNKISVLVINGDLIENPKRNTFKTINYYMKLFSYITKERGVEILINTGNHDITGISDGGLNFLNVFSYMDNVTVFNSMSIYQTSTIDFVFIPFSRNNQEIYDFLDGIIKTDEKDYFLFFHHDIDQINSSFGIPLHGNELNLTRIKSTFNGYNYKIINGHIHDKIELKQFKTIVLSSLFQTDFKHAYDDLDDVKNNPKHGYWILEYNDLHEYSFNFIPTKYNTVFYDIKYNKDFDIKGKRLRELIESSDEKFFNVRVIVEKESQEIRTKVRDLFGLLKTYDNVLKLQIVPKLTSDDENEKDVISKLDVVDVIEEHINNIKFESRQEEKNYKGYLKRLVENV